MSQNVVPYSDIDRVGLGRVGLGAPTSVAKFSCGELIISELVGLEIYARFGIDSAFCGHSRLSRAGLMSGYGETKSLDTGTQATHVSLAAPRCFIWIQSLRCTMTSSRQVVKCFTYVGLVHKLRLP